jgi:hypothetical protein
LKRIPVALVFLLLSAVISLGLRPRVLRKFVMCHLLPSLVSVIAFTASVPKFCLLSVFKILSRPRVGMWVREWACDGPDEANAKYRGAYLEELGRGYP